jgi:hypothetical protein
MEKEKSNQLRMWEVHDLYIQYIKEALSEIETEVSSWQKN